MLISLTSSTSSPAPLESTGSGLGNRWWPNGVSVKQCEANQSVAFESVGPDYPFWYSIDYHQYRSLARCTRTGGHVGEQCECDDWDLLQWCSICHNLEREREREGIEKDWGFASLPSASKWSLVMDGGDWFGRDVSLPPHCPPRIHWFGSRGSWMWRRRCMVLVWSWRWAVRMCATIWLRLVADCHTSQAQLSGRRLRRVRSWRKFGVPRKCFATTFGKMPCTARGEQGDGDGGEIVGDITPEEWRIE